MGITKKPPLRLAGNSVSGVSDIQINPYPVIATSGYAMSLSGGFMNYGRPVFASGVIYVGPSDYAVQQGYEDFEKQRLEQQLRETQAELDRVRGVVETPDPDKKKPVRLIVLPKEE